MSNVNLVVVGSINVDLTATVERLPGAGETVGGGILRRTPGGKGANQAVAARRLGADVRMVGAVGDDGDGAWSLQQLAHAGVDTTDVIVSANPTGTALIGVDRHGENQIIVCTGANGDVSLDRARIEADDTVLTQLEIELDLVARLAERHTGYLAVNAAPAQHLPRAVVDRVDLFIVNETEYARLPELAAARRVAVTYGGDGAVMVEHGVEVARVPAVRVEVVNTVGAGDAFCAALVLALRTGVSDEDALRIACGVGAAAVTHPDSQPPLERLDFYR
jgi:ribokinase